MANADMLNLMLSRTSCAARKWALAAWLAMLPACMFSGTSRADVTAHEIESYLGMKGQDWSWAPEFELVTDRLNRELRQGGIPAVGRSIGNVWRISPKAGEALAEALILQDVGWDSSPESRTREARIEAAVDRALQLAPDSVEVWASAQLHWYFGEGCEDEGHVANFFGRPWAREAFLAGKASHCDRWIVELPRFAPMDSRSYRMLSEWLDDDPEQLVAAFLRREKLAEEGFAADSPVMQEAQRAYWLVLAREGLAEEISREAGKLPFSQLEELLLRYPTQPLRYQAETIFALEDRRQTLRRLQLEWLFSLAAEGRIVEAKSWLARFKLPMPARGAMSAEPGHEAHVFAGDHADERALANLLIDGISRGDPFDLLVGDGEIGLLWTAGPPSVVDTLAIARYMQAADYSSIANDIRAMACRSYSPRFSTEQLERFPPRFREVRQHFMALLRDANQRIGDCRRSSLKEGAVELAPLRKTYVEHVLPAAMRSGASSEVQESGVDAMAPDAPGKGRAGTPSGLAAFDIVRYDNRGDLTAAISLSQEVDPVGEVSGGGFWLHLSRDHGRTWLPRRYLGLQQFVPYEIPANSKLPLINGRVLQLEVAVREIDPASITFPPVGLSTRREARDIFIELSLDEIERDTDGDRLTDFLEDKIRTNPHAPDTDMDGIRDDVDALPQSSFREPPSADSEVLAEVLSKLNGFDRKAIYTGGPGNATAFAESVLQSMLDPSTSRKAAPPPVLFIRSDPGLFHGIALPARVIFVNGDDVRYVADHYGLFYPLDMPIWFNRAHTKAVVRWDAGWVGGTLMFEKVRGHWQSREVSSWIT